MMRSRARSFMSSLPRSITNVPLPCTFSTSPSSASSLYALVTVSTLTRSSLASLRSEGSASPAVSSPDMIADLIWFLICS